MSIKTRIKTSLSILRPLGRQGLTEIPCSVESSPAPSGSCRFSGMDRSTLLNHIRATHFESGDRELALADAQRIAAYLVKEGARRVVGIGSAFEPSRPFTDRSDIDLVVEGIEPGRFFRCLPVPRP